MSKIQPTNLKSFSKSAAIGRRLIEQSRTSGPDKSVKDATFVHPELIGKRIQRCTALEGFVIGKAVVLAGEKFWLVRPNENPHLAHYFYVVTYRHGEYQCSSSDEWVIGRCINRVKAHREELKVAKLANAC